MTAPEESYREIPLTQGQVALVDVEDYERLSAYKWFAQWAPHTQNFYACRNIKMKDGKQRPIRMHREVVGISMDDPRIVDHRDSYKTLDNRKSNLRVCSYLENARNTKRRKDNTTGLKGVTLQKRSGRWIAQIQVAGKKKHIGMYDSPEKAYAAYCEVAKKIHGEWSST